NREPDGRMDVWVGANFSSCPLQANRVIRFQRFRVFTSRFSNQPVHNARSSCNKRTDGPRFSPVFFNDGMDDPMAKKRVGSRLRFFFFLSFPDTAMKKKKPPNLQETRNSNTW